MNLSIKVTLLRTSFLFACFTTAAMAQQATKPGHYLTTPREGTAEQIVLDYVNSSAFANAFENADLADLRLNAEVPSAKGRISHLYFDQYVNDIQIYRAILNASVMNDGRILSLGNRLVTGTGDASSLRSASLSAIDALSIAANHLGIAPEKEYQQLQAASGTAQAQVFDGGNLSYNQIPMRLQYVTFEGELRLAWFMIIRQQGSHDWWELHVDSATGEVLNQHNYTISEHFPPNAFSGHIKKATKAASMHGQLMSKNRMVDGSAYFAVPLGIESPNHGDLALINEPADAEASPFGWHDTDGATGAEFTITRGNNVHAFQARATDVSRFSPISQGDEPDGGASLQFNIVPDFDQQPVTYTDAATVNLFYWNNLAHDLMYHYGFDEVSGNFQETNYSGQGAGSDYVNAHVQGGADVGLRNNATFSTPSDGFNPAMNMFEWNGLPTLEVTGPSSIVGSYPTGSASFGGTFPQNGLSGILEVADDGSGVTTGCDPLSGFTAGRIAVIDRGGCEFGVKALSAENAGAIAVIIVNNAGTEPMGMGPGAVGDQVTIPVLSISLPDGNLFKQTILNDGDINVTIFGAIDLDSDYDSGIIMHEYGHGISNRLVGGPNTASCLNGPEQAGEGWSDFFGLVFTPGNGDVRTRGVGTYAGSEPTDGRGIREFPYSPDMEINPVTYDKLKDPNIAVPHGVGHTLNTVLWDLYIALIDEVGFDADLYTGTGGNNIAIMLVTESLKFMPCSPHFVDQRDALLAADEALYSGQFSCLIWQVFARRGLGENAIAGTSGSLTDGTEDFTVPASCACAPISVLKHPGNASGCSGSSVTLAVLASDDNASYQWFRNGQAVNGQTSSTMILVSATTADSGIYTCLVSNPCSEVMSQPSVVLVQDAPAFDNASLALWRKPLACGDLNSNNLMDIVDISALVTD